MFIVNKYFGSIFCFITMLCQLLGIPVAAAKTLRTLLLGLCTGMVLFSRYRLYYGKYRFDGRPFLQDSGKTQHQYGALL